MSTEVSNAPTDQQSAPAAVACPYCGQSPCCGDSPYFSIVHANDPAEIAKRAAHQTAVMLRMMPFGHPNY
jgi:hypothetical protein